MLDINDLSFSYSKEKPIYQKLTLSLPANNIIGILGQNGIGKTTLFNLIYGSLQVQEGTVHWNKQPISHSTIAYLETESFFYSYMTGKEYLKLIAYEKAGIAKNYTTHFNIDLNEYVDNYSTGMKKKLAFWGIVEQDRAIIILDEPFNGIDLESVEFFYHIINSLKNENRLIIVSSHILETLTNICDQIIYFEDSNNHSIYLKEQFSEIESMIKNRIRQKFEQFEKENNNKAAGEFLQAT